MSTIHFRNLGFLGFPNYAVDSIGRVWSRFQKGPGGRWVAGKWREAKPSGDRKGYLCLDLNHNGFRKTCKVHRLVLAAFKGSCPPGKQSRHMDGNKKNNRIGNLKWGTALENSQDQHRHGTRARGEKASKAKMTKAQVLEMRGVRSIKGWSYRKLGKMFGIGHKSVRAICLHLSWGHV